MADFWHQKIDGVPLHQWQMDASYELPETIYAYLKQWVQPWGTIHSIENKGRTNLATVQWKSETKQCPIEELSDRRIYSGQETNHPKGSCVLEVCGSPLEWGVRCTQSHCSYLLHRLGWDPEKSKEPLRTEYEPEPQPGWYMFQGEGLNVVPNVVVTQEQAATISDIPRIREYVKEHSLLCIHGSMGSGKTHFTLSEIEKLDPSIRIIWFSIRQAYANQFGARLAKMGFVNYLEVDKFEAENEEKELPNTHRVLVSLESVCRIPQHVEYDLIILDETTILMTTMASPTLQGKRDAVFARMKRLFQVPKARILCLDADLEENSVWWVSSWSRRSPFIVRHLVPPPPCDYFWYTDMGPFEDAFLSNIRSGRRVVMISNSKKTLRKLYYLLVHSGMQKNIRYYDSMTNRAELRQDLASLSDVWPNADVLFYSPVISAGTDFNMEHFDAVFASMCNLSTSVRESLQMMYRVRKLRLRAMHVYIAEYPLYDHIPITLPAMKKWNQDRLHRTVVDPEDQSWRSTDSIDQELILRIYLERSRSNRFYSRWFRCRISQFGPNTTITYVQITDDKKSKKDRTQRHKELDRLLFQEILSAPNLTPQEAKAIEEVSNAYGNVTREQLCALEKFQHKNLYRLSNSCILDEGFLKTFSKPGKKSQWSRLLVLMEGSDQAEARIRNTHRVEKELWEMIPDDTLLQVRWTRVLLSYGDFDTQVWDNAYKLFLQTKRVRVLLAALENAQYMDVQKLLNRWNYHWPYWYKHRRLLNRIFPNVFRQEGFQWAITTSNPTLRVLLTSVFCQTYGFLVFEREIKGRPHVYLSIENRQRHVGWKSLYRYVPTQEEEEEEERAWEEANQEDEVSVPEIDEDEIEIYDDRFVECE